MFACTRLARRRVYCPRLLWQSTPCATRLPLNRHNSSNASDPPAHDEADADTSEQLESEIFTDPQPNAVGYQEESRPESYGQFMDTIGKDFRHPSTRKWLGGAVVEFVFTCCHRCSYRSMLAFSDESFVLASSATI
jgi:hypothetical protein